jgi:sigma-B regulation protein RsbU (phosphoserine phosphatase)
MERKIGDVLCEEGYTTREQIQSALLAQSMMNRSKLLGQILIEEGYLTPSQAKLSNSCPKCLLLEMTARINSSTDLQSILLAIMESAEVIMEAEASSLITIDTKTQEMTIAVPTGPVSSEVMGIRIPPGKGICGWVATHGVPLIVEDVQKDLRFYGEVTGSGFSTKSIAAIPMHNSQGETIGILEVINRRDGSSFTEDDIPLLMALGNQAAIALERSRLQQDSMKKRLMDQELEIANQIQRNFWPKQMPVCEGIELTGVNLPAVQVSGDYYDFIEIDEDQCAIAIGDIAGKGVSAALLMATLRATLRAQVENNHPVDETISLVNNTLVKDTTPDRFATLFYGVLNTSKLEFTYVNAGHNPPFLYDNMSGEMKLLGEGGPIVGFLEDTVYTARTEKLRPGQVLVMYTDGITEAMNGDEEVFGEQRLIDVIRRYAEDSVGTLANRICRTVLDYAYDKPQYDDITLVLMKISKVV